MGEVRGVRMICLSRYAIRLTAGAVAGWLLAVLPAGAQFTPSFRPPMMAPISPIGPRDPGLHVAPGNITNIPMGGPTDGTTTTSRSINSGKGTKRVSRGSSPPSKSTTQVTAGSGRSFVPPPGETRLASDEVIVEFSGNPSAQVVDALIRRYRLVLLERLALRLTNSTVLRLRIPDRRSVTAVARAFAGDRGAVMQPNYSYAFAQETMRAPEVLDAPAGAQTGSPDAKAAVGDPAQYALAKLHLPEAQGLAKGERVLVA